MRGEDPVVATVSVMVRPIRGALATLLLVVTTAGCLFHDTAGPLTIEPPQLPQARLGTAYEAQITVTDNVTPVYQFMIRAGELPPGLKLVPSSRPENGVIRGVPKAAGTYAFTIWVACYGTQVSGQTGTRDYEIVVT